MRRNIRLPRRIYEEKYKAIKAEIRGDSDEGSGSGDEEEGW